MRFCLIDRVTAVQADERVTGIKNITVNEEVMRYHFPDYPVYPGTLVVEATAQLCGFLLEYSLNETGKELRRAVLMQIERAKFFKRMLPGDQLKIECVIESIVADAARLHCEVRVEDEMTASIQLQFKMFVVTLAAVHEQQRQVYQQWTSGLQLSRPIL